MISSCIYFGISIILDCIISNFINYQITNPSLLTPLFTIVAIPLIYPFFQKNNTKYLKVVTIFGLSYDLLITNTPILNTIIFFIIGGIVILANNLYQSNSLNTLFLTILLIITYNTLNYGVLYLINVHNYNISYLINIIKSTMILNVIYYFISYCILEFIQKKYKIKRIY